MTGISLVMVGLRFNLGDERDYKACSILLAWNKRAQQTNMNKLHVNLEYRMRSQVESKLQELLVIFCTSRFEIATKCMPK